MTQGGKEAGWLQARAAQGGQGLWHHTSDGLLSLPLRSWKDQVRLNDLGFFPALHFSNSVEYYREF